MTLAGASTGEAGSRIPRFTFTTRTLPVGDQFDAYRQTLSVASDFWRGDAVEKKSSFLADFAAFDFGEMLLTTEKHAALEFGLTERQIRRIGLDHLIIGVIKGGEVNAIAGRSRAHYGPGTIGCFSLSTPSRGHASNLDVTYLCIQRDALRRHLRIVGPEFGLALDARLSQLVADHILALERQAGSFAAEDAARVTNATLSLVAACLSPCDDSLAHAEATIGLVLRDRVLRYIQANLHSPSLSPDQICGAFQLSRSSLYRLFESRGGVAKEIKNQRLDAAFRVLREGHDRRKLYQLSEDLGFTSPGEFSRTFRRTYGVSPREVMEAEENWPTAYPASAEEDSFANWLTGLMKRSR